MNKTVAVTFIQASVNKRPPTKTLIDDAWNEVFPKALCNASMRLYPFFANKVNTYPIPFLPRLN